MLPEIDESAWPIVRIRYRPGLTLDEIRELAVRLTALVERRGPMLAVANIAELTLKAMSAEHRRLLASEADRLAARHAFIAEAVVLPSPVLRVLYARYTWARHQHDHPCSCFVEEQAALAWAQSFLPARPGRAQRARLPS